MVKGVSKQVIVLHSPDQKLFEQAIFILKEEALCNGGITDEELMKEAKRLLRERQDDKQKKSWYGIACLFSGALITSFLWLITALF